MKPISTCTAEKAQDVPDMEKAIVKSPKSKGPDLHIGLHFSITLESKNNGK